MKKILCYGDSNTFGFNPKNGSRFSEKNRWAGILKNNLKDYFEVVEEGLNNRNGFVDNPCGASYCGLKHFPEVLKTNKNTEILIFALGTNDLQFQYNIEIETIEKGLLKFIGFTNKYNIKTIIIPPVVLDERILKGGFSFQFDKSSILKSKQMPAIYEKIAKETKSLYFDFNLITKPSDYDGLHYDSQSHCLIAEKLSEFIVANI